MSEASFLPMRFVVKNQRREGDAEHLTKVNAVWDAPTSARFAHGVPNYQNNVFRFLYHICIKDEPLFRFSAFQTHFQLRFCPARQTLNRFTH